MNGALFIGGMDYRLLLHRDIEAEPFTPVATGKLLFVMLNPSTADHEINDPTITRCMGFAKRWGYGDLTVANLFALRATNPNELLSHEDPIGEDNDVYLKLVSKQADLIVAAWGAHPAGRERAEVVKAMWASMDIEVKCLGTTKDGSPKHPLYLRKGTLPQPFPLGEIDD